MEIKHLQAIAKRQQNQIAYMESVIETLYSAYVASKDRKFLVAFWDAKRELKKWVVLQKSVKNEIKFAIQSDRFDRAVRDALSSDYFHNAQGVLQ